MCRSHSMTLCIFGMGCNLSSKFFMLHWLPSWFNPSTQTFSTSIRHHLLPVLGFYVLLYTVHLHSPHSRSDFYPLTVSSPSSPFGLCWHISPPQPVSFPLTLEQMAGPCSLCVSLTDRGRSSTSIDNQSYAAPLSLSSPTSCPLTLLLQILLQTSFAPCYSSCIQFLLQFCWFFSSILLHLLSFI